MTKLLIGRRLSNLRFLVGLLVLLIIQFALLRAGLIWRTHSAGVASTAQLRHAFAVGMRFDLATACYISAPFVIAAYLPWTAAWRGPRTRRWFLWTLSIIVGLLSFLLLCEFEFFREFQSRYNQLAIRYWSHPTIVGGMVWYNYPVIRYVCVGLLFAAVFHIGLRFVLRWAYPIASKPLIVADESPRFETPRAGRMPWLIDVAAGTVIVAAIVIGARGGLQREPLRWGDAFKGDSEFANQMSLNGLFSLANAIGDVALGDRATRQWVGAVGEKDGDGDGDRDADDGLREARRLTQSMILAPAGERFLDVDKRTALRIGDPGSRVVLTTASGRRPNVVIVLMEGFSARYVGACGAPRSFTPRFDAIAKEGTLYNRAFSAGTHTHQGVFASQLGFPNLPGYEELMESSAGNQHFCSAASIFQARGYQTKFFYNGQFYWDNMIGFFHKQGVDAFVGCPEMQGEAKYVDKVWGVSDEDVFDRADREFKAAAPNGPFFATILTLSNHAPFQIPSVPGLEPITDQGEMNGRLTAMQYADWSVGHFIDEARKQPYFNDTLFVFVGDHGFHVPPVLTELQLLYHHVPMVYYAPGLVARTADGAPATLAGVVDPRVASHVNLIPSILGLLGIKDAPQSSWGRSLFNDTFADANFAVIKNSGDGRVVGLLRDDALMIVGSASGKPLLLRYSVGAEPSVHPINDPALQATMTRELRAFVRSGLDDLTHSRAGPIEETTADGR